MSTGAWFRVAGDPTADAHVFNEPARTRCDRTLPIGEELDPYRGHGTARLCPECMAAIQAEAANAPQPEAPDVEECSCIACSRSSVRIAHDVEMLASVCPGCHAVGGERCAPGCIDAEIARARECDDEAERGEDDVDEEEGSAGR